MGLLGIAREGLLARRFELRERLGEGGMGVVYRAWDRALGKEVALKRMHEIGPMQAQRLKSEFRTRSALQHRNLVQLFELVTDGDDCFFTMELVDGTDLESWVRHGRAAPLGAATGSGPAARDGDPKTATTIDGRARGDAPEPAARSGVRATKRPLDAAALARLRAALSELCVGLSVLHDAAVVHRDVKPANVMVTASGRVVLLDFGLAATQTLRPPDLASAGTPRYMAPEQVRADATTAAADLYAVGGILYELLAGRSPFGGSMRTNQVTKAAGSRPPPIAGETPDEDLANLAMLLLDPEPHVRPDARGALRHLAAGADVPSLSPTFGLPVPGGFVGRQSEVAALKSALRRVESERIPVAVLVEGPSGIGKTTLLRSFLADLKAREKHALVLSSRCHPQETVPFKALDAAMDALAAHARAMFDLGSFEPAIAQAVVRVFPVFRTVPELGAHPAPVVSPDEPDLRARGFDALREVLARLAARGPVVLWIDDMQWDDADSLAVLEALLRPFGAPAPPLLLILSMRSDSRESVIVERLLEPPPRALVPVERVRLGPLEDVDAARLAAVFLGEGDARVARVVSQSEGDPFLTCELARYLASAPSDTELAQGALDVQALVAARLRDLAPAERALLDVASIAVRPLATTIAIEAAHLEAEARTAILALRDAFLLRQGPSAAGEAIAPYHDKIAEATQRLLSSGDRAAIHRSLAETLERHAPDDADALSVHWEGAGETERAAACAYRAAERAAATLAFDRAAELYEKAIALGGGDVERAILLERAAAAHANHGRAAEAARRYLDASRELGDAVASAHVRTLKRLAAEQYVKGGYVRLGWEVMRSVLAAAGVEPPASPTRAMLGALRRRLRFVARRIDVDGIRERRIPEAERPRLEALWTASTSMSMVNVTLSDAFRTQHLERILDVGDASSVARALAYEVALEAHVGGPLFDWHAERLLNHARRLVALTKDPYDAAWLELGIANQAYCSGRFYDAVLACNRSLSILRESCSGVAWEITTVMAFLLTSLAMLGDLPALREAAERFSADAEHRGDLFGVAEGYGGECVLAWWSRGAGDDALARARDAVARQGGDAERWPEKTYRRGQLTELMGTVHLQLIAGDPWPAWRMLIDHWGELKSAMIPSLQFYRSWLRHGRARVALAAAERCDSGRGQGGWTRERLLADARKMRREIDKDTRPFAAPWAALVEGGLAHADADRSRALAALERAVAGFDRAGMALYREAARFRLGELSASPLRRDEAEAWMRRQGVPDPRALVDALVPGFRGAT
ncbi:MAG: protein kinase [Labilithrix sp.]|nr:protein kinase [Labilithrix sp.]